MSQPCTTSIRVIFRGRARSTWSPLRGILLSSASVATRWSDGNSCALEGVLWTDAKGKDATLGKNRRVSACQKEFYSLTFYLFRERHTKVDGKITYDESYLDELCHAQIVGALKTNLFTQHLLNNAKIIRTGEDFGDNFTNNIDWLTSTTYYGPQLYLTSSKDTKLDFCLDTDFTGFVTETLEFIVGSWEMVFCPNFNVRLNSCKMRYMGKALHKCTSIGFGWVPQDT